MTENLVSGFWSCVSFFFPSSSSSLSPSACLNQPTNPILHPEYRLFVPHLHHPHHPIPSHPRPANIHVRMYILIYIHTYIHIFSYPPLHTYARFSSHIVVFVFFFSFWILM
ncbi:hypothetical protein CPB84DRAFT_1495940 [Gymnopilus junonius]|uniref:Uncharacterized protein n=1 Tax=Gymnopilus junonius TaxID=109634 RepID=A0A9P5TRQ5_GYMJU|nr:hypothetical protein CPB84DRAFT_1495940 [Gymnopilus junonius]